MNEHARGGPVAEWRGYDPDWSDLQYQTILVAAPCEAVAAELAHLRSRMQQVIEPSAAPLELVSDEEVHFVFRLAGHRWSQAYCYYHPISQEDAQRISQRLSTCVLCYDSCDEGRSFDLYDQGILQEALIQGGEPAIYQGPRGQADLQRRVADGWQISLTPMVEYFSRNYASLDLKSLDENATFERVVRELKIFVAYYPWWFDEDVQRIELNGHWRPEHFAELRVVFGLPRQASREPDVPLVITDDDAEFRLLRKFIESDENQDWREFLKAAGGNDEQR